MFCIAEVQPSSNDSKIGNHMVASPPSPCTSCNVVQHKVNNFNMHLIRGARYLHPGSERVVFAFVLMQDLPKGDVAV